MRTNSGRDAAFFGKCLYLKKMLL